MENSSEYKQFLSFINASTREKMDGYKLNIFENIYEWERDELEDIIWERFNNESNIELACYLPRLKKYDGIEALQNKLSECAIPSRESRMIAKVLYNSTGKDCYLDIFKENYEKSKENLYIIVTELYYCKPGKKMFDMLCDIYLNCNEELAVNSAAWGIFFYIKGIDPNITLTEKIKYIPIVNMLTECEITQRMEQFKKLKNGIM